MELFLFPLISPYNPKSQHFGEQNFSTGESSYLFVTLALQAQGKEKETDV